MLYVDGNLFIVKTDCFLIFFLLLQFDNLRAARAVVTLASFTPRTDLTGSSWYRRLSAARDQCCPRGCRLELLSASVAAAAAATLTCALTSCLSHCYESRAQTDRHTHTQMHACATGWGAQSIAGFDKFFAHVLLLLSLLSRQKKVISTICVYRCCSYLALRG